MGLDAVLGAITEERLLALQLAFAETPAPTFAESARAALICDIWREAGLAPEIDAAGNVIAARPKGSEGPFLAISAHLDTVFPAGQDVRVSRPGDACPHCGVTVPPGEYHGPGIADCAAGLAAVTAIAKALHAMGAATAMPLLFAATVGEEGEGNLKGARALFDGAWGARIAAFVTVDTGAPGFIAHTGTASRRFRAGFHGPGGHAWAEYGTYNPIHAAGAAIARIAALDVPHEPRSSLNVGVLNGGRSVNTIPETASFDLDLRSVDPATLDWLTKAAHAAVHDAHEEIAARSRGEARYSIDIIGERPGGSTPSGDLLVRDAIACCSREGLAARLGPGSTDANVPMARGVPAIAFPWGGSSRGAHSVRETFRSEGRLASVRALARLALTYPTSSGSAGSAAHSESEAS